MTFGGSRQLPGNEQHFDMPYYQYSRIYQSLVLEPTIVDISAEEKNEEKIRHFAAKYSHT